jgi:hypothetical protein
MNTNVWIQNQTKVLNANIFLEIFGKICFCLHLFKVGQKGCDTCDMFPAISGTAWVREVVPIFLLICALWQGIIMYDQFIWQIRYYSNTLLHIRRAGNAYRAAV